MRKRIVLIFILVFLLGFTGCVSAEESSEQMITMATGTQETESGTPAATQIAFAFQGESVIPGEPLPEKLETLAIASNQVDTCVGTGKETVYQYPGFDITVHNNSTSDYVYSIYFDSPDILTTEGLSIGDNQDKVLALYGEADVNSGFAWIYSDGNTELILLMSDNAVVSIEYRLIL